MTLTKTPVCDFNKKAKDFKLKSINGDLISLNDIRGEKATLIMFICNHCPYVKAIIKDLVTDCEKLKKEGVNSIAVMSNDTKNYPEDSFENMIKFAKENQFDDINYLIDETQEIAKDYEAVCTPDFFGYNKDLKLQYRGRFRELENLKPVINGDSDLKISMKMIAQTQKGPDVQIPSMGCNIKWFN
ncbi:MAG: Peroxiredoxin [Pelagibacterales bacterium]|jgi:peroxiredoxin|nr:Peroxiredoxin [Pelagibacterales bacterium]|tara:strand:+ start:20 stop:577 length:558 start_codon:yes stop_codon:yes gene_type:complete